jgi:hypothetical protein
MRHSSGLAKEKRKIGTDLYREETISFNSAVLCMSSFGRHRGSFVTPFAPRFHHTRLLSDGLIGAAVAFLVCFTTSLLPTLRKSNIATTMKTLDS